MVLYLWPAHGGRAAAECASGGGICPDRDAAGTDLAGRPHLRLRLASPLCTGGDPRPVHLPQAALARARRYGAAIQYDETAQAPWFRYTDGDGVVHEVWFEDARSIRAKLALIPEYGLRGVGYWNLMRDFPQNWRVLNALYRIREA